MGTGEADIPDSIGGILELDFGGRLEGLENGLEFEIEELCLGRVGVFGEEFLLLLIDGVTFYFHYLKKSYYQNQP